MDQPWWGSGETLALTISEAARICGLKRRAIRRRHEAGEFAHSYRDADGTWRIPLNDLIAAGLEPNLEREPEESRAIPAPMSHVERLRTEVAVLRERVRALEIIAREREERVEDLRTILRMLPAPEEIDELSPGGAEVASSTEAHASPEFEKEIEEEVTLEEVFGVEDLEPAASSHPPTPAPGAFRHADAASPFDASRADSPPLSTEPIVVIPHAVEPVPVRSEEERQRPAELLQGAMSLWWPSPERRAQDEGWSRPLPDVTDEWRVVASDLASREEQGDEASPGSDEPDRPEGDIISNPFPADSYEEAPYEWMDPAFDRAPRHRRRRLGRFFRRDRRPR